MQPLYLGTGIELSNSRTEPGFGVLLLVRAHPSIIGNLRRYADHHSTIPHRSSVPKCRTDRKALTREIWSAYAYDCVVTAALSIQAADEFTAAALGEVVRDVTRPDEKTVTSYQAAADILADGCSPSDIDYQGVSGPIELDENGDPTGFSQVLTVDDHSYQPTGFLGF